MILSSMAIPTQPASNMSQAAPKETESISLPEINLPLPKLPSGVPTGISEPPSATKNDEETGWKVDPTTGKRYKVLPKTEMGADNRPVLHLTDLDLEDLTGEAEKYLAHLRVPPDPEERARLLAEKKRLMQVQNEKYRLNNARDLEE